MGVGRPNMKTETMVSMGTQRVDSLRAVATVALAIQSFLCIEEIETVEIIPPIRPWFRWCRLSAREPALQGAGHGARVRSRYKDEMRSRQCSNSSPGGGKETKERGKARCGECSSLLIMADLEQ